MTDPRGMAEKQKPRSEELIRAPGSKPQPTMKCGDLLYLVPQVELLSHDGEEGDRYAFQVEGHSVVIGPDHGSANADLQAVSHRDPAGYLRSFLRCDTARAEANSPLRAFDHLGDGIPIDEARPPARRIADAKVLASVVLQHGVQLSEAENRFPCPERIDRFLPGLQLRRCRLPFARSTS